MITFDLLALSRCLEITWTSQDLALARSLSFIPSDVVLDSRKAKARSLFIALKGDNFDAHDFINQVMQAGASIAIIDDNKKSQVFESLNEADIQLAEDQYLIAVKETKLALGQIAAMVRRLSPAQVVALTGSSGKTSVKEMTASILTNMGRVIATQGNFNNEIGVPLTLLRLTGQEEYAVIELGANHRGEIAYTASMSAPDAVLINSISAAHLEGFGSLLGVAYAKSEIFTFPVLTDIKQLEFTSEPKAATNSDLTLMMNADIIIESSSISEQSQSISATWAEELKEFWFNALSKHNHTTYFSANYDEIRVGSVTVPVGYSISDLKKNGNGSAFVLHTPKGEVGIHLALLGRHAINNALGAAALAQSVGATLEAIKCGLESVKPVEGRLYPILLNHSQSAEQWLIDDSYNANVGSMKAAIDTLSDQSGYKIFIVGDMAELGDYSLACHKTIGLYAAKANIDAVYSVGIASQSISESHHNGHHFHSKSDLIKALKIELNNHPSLTCIVKGSRSAAMEEIVKALQEK